MAKAALADTDFRRNERVLALQDLPGVPAGTPGKVLLVDGLSWIRYRVLFDNGLDVGSLDPKYLSRPRDFDRRRVELEEGAARAEAAAEVAGDDTAASEAGAAEGATVNGVNVPAHLLERSARARERFAG